MGRLSDESDGSDLSDWSENLSDWSENRSDCSEDLFSFLIAMFGCQNGKMYLCDPKFQNNYNLINKTNIFL